MSTVLEITPGVPPDWPELTTGLPAAVRPRWITFGQSWYPGAYHTYALRDADGGCIAALGGAVLPERPAVARRDPYAILSGELAAAGFLPHGPHPWQGLDPGAPFPCLMLMYPYYQTLPVGSAAAEPAVLYEYVATLVDWAAGQGVRSIVLPYLTAGSEDLVVALRKAGFGVGHLLDRCDLPVKWSDFDGYLATLPSKRRIEVRRELAQTAERGLVPVCRPLAAREPELLDLRCQLVAKYSGTVDRAAEAAMLESIRAHVRDEDLCVFALLDGNRTVSFSLFIQDGSEWTAMLTGSDYTTANSALGYFSTLFYQPIREASGRGIHQISYGPASVDAKRRRGCTVSACYVAELRIA
ncbi:GNAT family N-acetyltransferase [Actinoplanes sp. NPDC051346]|uniref:GNAT family N-acetyltransferase n=1 Tax=Actinoplanes sp. NPDC051346 TaxID=3155048 RepID=UPI00343EC5D6